MDSIETKPRTVTKTDALRLARRMLADAGIEIEQAYDRWAAEYKLAEYLWQDIPAPAFRAAVAR